MNAGDGATGSGRSFDVCVVGSSNLDLVVTTARHPSPGETVLGGSYHEYPGGKGLNQAVAATRAGARCSFVTALGDDAAASRLAAVLADEGIDGGSVERVGAAPTGRAVITVDDAGENSIVVVAGANARLRAATLPVADVVLAQLEVPVDVVADALHRARLAGASTILNPAPAAELEDAVLAACSVVIPNEHEVQQLGGVERLLRLGVGVVITTLGVDGAEVATTDGREHIAPFDVLPVDTTGAGDAFCGAFATAVAQGRPTIEAARFAAAAGALATTRAGAVPSLPHRAAIDAMLGR